MLEVEVKIRANHKEIQTKLDSLGFTMQGSEVETDTYFNSEFKNLKNEDKALRIRETKSNNIHVITMNYKGPKVDETTMTREEVEFEVPSYEVGETLLYGLGFGPAGRVKKTRTYYKKDNCTCCLDEVDGLGEFLEVEIMAEEKEYDKSLKYINEILLQLGLRMEDSIRTSYLSMLQEL